MGVIVREDNQAPDGTVDIRFDESGIIYAAGRGGAAGIQQVIPLGILIRPGEGAPCSGGIIADGKVPPVGSQALATGGSASGGKVVAGDVIRVIGIVVSAHAIVRDVFCHRAGCSLPGEEVYPSVVGESIACFNDIVLVLGETPLGYGLHIAGIDGMVACDKGLQIAGGKYYLVSGGIDGDSAEGDGQKGAAASSESIVNGAVDLLPEHIVAAVVADDAKVRICSRRQGDADAHAIVERSVGVEVEVRYGHRVIAGGVGGLQLGGAGCNRRGDGETAADLLSGQADGNLGGVAGHVVDDDAQHCT